LRVRSSCCDDNDNDNDDYDYDYDYDGAGAVGRATSAMK
jgi:hypothetical protein